MLQPRSHSTPNNRVQGAVGAVSTPSGSHRHDAGAGANVSSPGKTVRMSEQPDEQPRHRHVCRTFSVESNGESTLSLLSALNHESNENLSQFSNSDEEHDTLEVTHNIEDTQTRGDCLETADKATQAEHDSSPWQQWIARKNTEKQKQLQEDNEECVKKLQHKQRKVLETKQHEDMVKMNVNLWMQKKDLDRLRTEQEQKRKERVEKSEKEIAKMNTNEKAKVRYKQWRDKKHNEDKDAKKKSKEEQAENEERKMSRRQEAEQKYDDWFRRAKNRPKTTPVSYGYTQGRLAGFYNWSTYPTPSYYNPVPWTETIATTNRRTKNNKQKVTLSPPLLWKQREQKEKDGELYKWR